MTPNSFEASITAYSEAIAANDDQNLLPILLDAGATSYYDSYEATGLKDDLKLAISDWQRAVALDPNVNVSPDCILFDSEERDDAI